MADSIYEVVGWWITIGDAVSGGTANTILFSDGSINLADSTDLFWDDNLKIFHVWDFGLALNSTYIALDDQNSLITNQTDGVFKVMDSASAIKLSIDMANDIYKFWAVSSGNSTLITVDDATVNKKVTSSGTVISVWALNSTNAPTSDPITISGTFTGSATTTYTVTVAGSWVDFNWTDWTSSGTNVPMDFGNPVLMSQGISVTFDWFAYTPTEYWTKAYTSTVVERLSLDYKNDLYQIGNLSVSWLRSRLYIDAVSGIASLRTFNSSLWITSFIQTEQTWVSFSSSDATNGSNLTGAANQTRLTTTNLSTFDTGNLLTTNNSAWLYFQDGNSSSYWWTRATNGVVSLWDFDLIGNSTLITVNDAAKTIKSTGGIIYNYTAQTGTYAILRNDYLINCTSGTFTVTLPTAVGFAGQTYIIKNSGAGVITLATTSSQTIDGVTTQTLASMVSLTVTSTWANRIIV